jgi:hypothetical protein
VDYRIAGKLGLENIKPVRELLGNGTVNRSPSVRTLSEQSEVALGHIRDTSDRIRCTGVIIGNQDVVRELRIGVDSDAKDGRLQIVPVIVIVLDNYLIAYVELCHGVNLSLSGWYVLSVPHPHRGCKPVS